MISVILLLAGKGKRMGYQENKILMEINHKPAFLYPLETFLKLGLEVICVISHDDEEKIVPLLPKGVKYTYGGDERGNSVYNGLLASNGDYVLIHDGARILISEECILNIIKHIDYNRVILTYLNVKDTIKEIKNNKIVTLNRSNLISATTPQCGSKSLFLNAYEKAFEDNLVFTDDISLIEKYYPDIKIDLIEANQNNFKLTTKIDYNLAKMIIEENLK